MARVIIVFLLMTNVYSVHASFLLPNHLLGMRYISNEFRLPIKNKLLQLRQNFIERKMINGARFISNELVTCPLGIQVLKNFNLVTYEYTQTSQQDKDKVVSFENRFIKGCEQKDSLVEKLKVVGNKEFFSSISAILNGDLDLTLQDGQEQIDYRLEDGVGKQVMRLYTKIENDKRLTLFYLGSEKYIQIQYQKRQNVLDVRFKYYPIFFELNRNSFSHQMNIEQKFNGFYRAIISQSGGIQYFNEIGQQISLASFQKIINLSGINFIMDSLLIELPATQFVTTGNTSARFMEELRNAQIWLINGNPTQLNLVRNLINEYIEAVNNGLIIDNRPKKQ